MGFFKIKKYDKPVKDGLQFSSVLHKWEICSKQNITYVSAQCYMHMQELDTTL